MSLPTEPQVSLTPMMLGAAATTARVGVVERNRVGRWMRRGREGWRDEGGRETNGQRASRRGAHGWHNSLSAIRSELRSKPEAAPGKL